MRNWLFAAMTYLAAATAIPSVAADLDTQKSADRGVTVAVTPQNLAGETRTWDFKIVLDTHSADLNDDLVKSSLLLGGASGRYAPVAWDGAPPGGHHPRGGAADQARLSAAAIDRAADQAGGRNRAALVPLETQMKSQCPTYSSAT